MRSGIILTSLFIVAACCVLWGLFSALLGNLAVGTYMTALGCFSMLCMVYLEEYLHRG